MPITSDEKTICISGTPVAQIVEKTKISIKKGTILKIKMNVNINEDFPQVAFPAYKTFIECNNSTLNGTIKMSGAKLISFSDKLIKDPKIRMMNFINDNIQFLTNDEILRIGKMIEVRMLEVEGDNMK